MFRFKCASCDEWHEGLPAFGRSAPAPYFAIPEGERATRALLSSDQCIIDDREFYVLARLEVPVIGLDDRFTWLIWVSLSEASYAAYELSYEWAERDHLGPFFAWIAEDLPLYPATAGLKSLIHLMNQGMRPRVELEPTGHPLAIDHAEGISAERAAGIVTFCQHGQEGSPGTAG
jgi:hypothetical protein